MKRHSELEAHINNLTYIEMVEQISYHSRKITELPMECQSFIKSKLDRLGVGIDNFEEDLLLYYIEYNESHWEDYVSGI